jgi:hypothetical protein
MWLLIVQLLSFKNVYTQVDEWGGENKNYLQPREDYYMTKSCTPRKSSCLIFRRIWHASLFCCFARQKQPFFFYWSPRALSEIHPLSAVRHGSAPGRMRRRSIEAPSAAVAGAPKAKAFYCAKQWRCSHAVPACRLYYFQLQRHCGARLWFHESLLIAARSATAVIISANFHDPTENAEFCLFCAQQAWGAFVFLCASTPFWNEFKSLDLKWESSL